MTERDAAAALRKVAALRSLVARLPRLETPLKAARLRRFEVLTESPHAATTEDIDALVSGWARWWRTGQVRRILAMAESVPEEIVTGDRRLQSLREGARAAAGR